ncbi:hypothetical protein ACT3R2_08875 [Halomonas sp. AOP43-D1-39]|uniref:hypothetical protein n=1 Tax=Halomonas sp. AOP43-D1-39 TaxID=3457659 RepID=UPI004034A632
MQLSSHKLPLQISFKVIQALTWRLAQALVIFPGAILAIVLSAGVVLGMEPVRTTVEGIMQYAENNVRPASEGYALSVPCTVPELGEGPQPIRCDATEAVEVPISEIVDNTMVTIFKFYFVLVAFSFLVLVFMYPGRKYLGLTPKLH